MRTDEQITQAIKKLLKTARATAMHRPFGSQHVCEATFAAIPSTAGSCAAICNHKCWCAAGSFCALTGLYMTVMYNEQLGQRASSSPARSSSCQLVGAGGGVLRWSLMVVVISSKFVLNAMETRHESRDLLCSSLVH